MRKKTVRRGLRFIAVGILCLMVATFFPAQASRLLFLGIGGEVRLTFFGFFLGGMCGGCGVLVAAAGLLQSGSEETRVRLAPTVMLLLSLVVLFFVLAYNSVTAPQTTPLQPGDSVNI
jgi:preprotein translocase subunit Sec61beta